MEEDRRLCYGYRNILSVPLFSRVLSMFFILVLIRSEMETVYVFPGFCMFHVQVLHFA